MLAYLTNLFKQVYLTAVMAASSEFVAYMVAGCVLEKLGTKISLISFYAIAGAGGLSMLTYGLDNQESKLFPVLFLVCRFGISGIYMLSIAVNARLFDV